MGSAAVDRSSVWADQPRLRTKKPLKRSRPLRMIAGPRSDVGRIASQSVPRRVADRLTVRAFATRDGLAIVPSSVRLHFAAFSTQRSLVRSRQVPNEFPNYPQAVTSQQSPGR